MSERETAIGLEVANRLTGESVTEVQAEELPDNAKLLHSLRNVAPELYERWRGAVFALDSRNPDAARHFCSSAREIFTQLLVLEAPDEAVVEALPGCDLTDKGKPTRRSKVRYLLRRRGIASVEMEDFAENDMDNIVELFDVLNAGTHGPAGVFAHAQLQSVKKRVEDGVVFLTEIARLEQH